MLAFARNGGAARTALSLITLAVGGCSASTEPATSTELAPPPATVTERRDALPLPVLPDAPRGLGSMTARVPGTTDVVGGVRLATHHATVTIDKGIAHTEVIEEFRNDSARVLEGRLSLPLPADATLARLALWVGTTLVEGEVVERTRAGLIFRGIVDDTVRPRDPALLDVVAGGKLSLRIFPLPAHGTRKVLFAYDEVLRRRDGKLHYVHPLSLGGDRATVIDALRVTVNGVVRVDAEHSAPGGDVVVPIDEPPPALAVGTRGKESGVVVRTLAEAPADAKPFRGDVVIALDVSEGQSGPSLAAQLHFANAVLGYLGPDESFAILACDTACASYPTVGRARPSDATLDEARTFLAGLEASGASDPAGALVTAAARLDHDKKGQVLLASDGTATAGELSVATQLAHVSPALEGVDVRVLGVGRAVDDRSLSALARGLGATYDRVATGAALATRVAELAAARRAPVVRASPVALPAGVTDAEPPTAPPTRAGEEIVTFARASAPLDDAATVAAPVMKLWARERVAELEAKGDDANAELTALSIKHHLLSRTTSLLVLENDRMFAEFGIARTRPDLDATGTADAPAPPAGESFGVGRLSGSHATRGPSLRMGATTVSGRVPPEVIQRVVRQSFGRFRACYEQGLRRSPSLTGRVATRFVIGRDGSVTAVSDGGSDLPDPEVAACVRRAFASLSFPQPEGGIVTVVYPLSFVPADGGGGSPPPEAAQKDPVPPPPAPRAADIPPTLPRNSALNPPPAYPAYPPTDVATAQHRAGDDRWTTASSPRVDTLAARAAREPEKRRNHLELIRSALTAGRFDDAHGFAKALIALDPDLPEAREALAETAAVLGRADEAVRAMATAAALDRRSPSRQLAAARAAHARGDAARACAHLRALGDLSTKTHGARAEVCRKSGTATLPDAIKRGFEVKVTCDTGDCPIVALITPMGRVSSPWTAGNAGERDATGPLMSGTYRTVWIAGPRVGDVTAHALGTTWKARWPDGDGRTLVTTDVKLPQRRPRIAIRW